MITQKVINPTPVKGWVSRTFDKGVSSYDLDSAYSPDTAFAKSVVLDLASPKFDPNKSYIFDKTKYNNHGTFAGGTSWIRLPSGIWGVKLDGADGIITIPASAALAPTAFTIKCWLKTTGTSQGIFSGRWNTVNAGIELYITGAGKLGAAIPAVADLMTPNALINTGAPTHIALTRNAGGDYITYVNGVQDSTASNASALTWDAWCIGKTDFTYLAGTVALFQGLNRVLTLGEIASIYNRERSLFNV